MNQIIFPFSIWILLNEEMKNKKSIGAYVDASFENQFYFYSMLEYDIICIVCPHSQKNCYYY